MRNTLVVLRFMAILALTVTPAFVFANQSSTALTGQVKDQSGALVPGAKVVLSSAAGVEKATTTDETGKYTFASLARGKYLLRVSAKGFGSYESEELEIGATRVAIHDVTLLVTLEKEEVNVDSESTSARLSPENNAGAIVLRGKDLDALPDDPDDLAAVLQGLAGPAIGPNGGQVIVDGFTNAPLPSKASIREVRINQNPFSAEFDQLGFGRIEIVTRAGTDKFRGQTFFNFNDESLNARNPFAPTRAPFQSRFYGGYISGPITKTSNYFIDFQRRELNDNAVINATILDPALNITPFSTTVLAPKRFITFSPRADFQLNKDHTLGARYSYSRSLFDKAGVGDFSLESRSFDALFNTHTFQMTETAVLGPTVVNELRFQYIHISREQTADLLDPQIRVLESFNGGGSSVGQSLYKDHRWELTNTTTKMLNQHTLRFGARLRGVHVTDRAETNFGGTWVFEGGDAPLLDANNEVVIDSGSPVIVPISSIERYRRTLLFQQLGLPASEIRTRGGGATQFSIAGGDPKATVNQVDFGGFILDDWRLRPNFTLSLGLRYEAQSNIHNKINFAPRVGFAWSPGVSGAANRTPKTVIRGGFGVFYERFPETLTLQSNRYDGTTQQLFYTTDPFILDFFPNLPSPDQLQGFTLPSSIRRVEQNLREPYSMQVALSVERQLPRNTTLSMAFIKTRTLHMLRTRNVNAPLPPELLARPNNNLGDDFLYEASGVQNLQQLIFSFFNRLSSKMTFFGSYVIGQIRNNTDGVNTFPVNSYDLSGEYGRGAFDIRQRFFAGGTINAPWGITLNPIAVANSSRPFNITTGADANLDSVYAERPAFAVDPTQPGVIVTPFGAFDPNPAPGQPLVPRNLGDGPSVFWISLRAGKTFGFGSLPARAGGPPPEKPYRLAVSVQVQNIFNHTNAGPAIGNLSSPLFGQSNTLGGGTFSDGTGSSVAGGYRRIELQLRFSF